MQAFRKSVFCIAGATFLFALTACYYHRKNETFSSVASVAPHFSSINSGIIQPKCMPCHDSSMKGRDFSSYAGVLKLTTPYAPGSSSFYTQIEAGTMPVDRPMLSDDEILAIYEWIKNGALND